MSYLRWLNEPLLPEMTFQQAPFLLGRNDELVEISSALRGGCPCLRLGRLLGTIAIKMSRFWSLLRGPLRPIILQCPCFNEHQTEISAGKFSLQYHRVLLPSLNESSQVLAHSWEYRDRKWSVFWFSEISLSSCYTLKIPDWCHIYWSSSDWKMGCCCCVSH